MPNARPGPAYRYLPLAAAKGHASQEALGAGKTRGGVVAAVSRVMLRPMLAPEVPREVLPEVSRWLPEVPLCAAPWLGGWSVLGLGVVGEVRVEARRERGYPRPVLPKHEEEEVSLGRLPFSKIPVLLQKAIYLGLLPLLSQWHTSP